MLCAAPLPTARALAKAFVSRRPPHRLPWRWDASMAMLGLAHLMDVCPQARSTHLEDLESYQSAHIRTPRITLSDHCLGAQSSVKLMQWRPSTEASFAMARVAQYLRCAPENDGGVLDHLGRRAWFRHLAPEGAWVDSMMMYVLTAARLSQSLGEPWLCVMGLRHAEAFCAQLQGPEGLFRHTAGAEVHWLRGNGWAAASLVELLEISDAAPLRRAYLRQARALLELQGEDGLWSSVVDDDACPRETSGSAMVAYALARGARLGVLPREARDAAWRTWSGLVPRLHSVRAGLSIRGISLPVIPGPRFLYRWTPMVSGLSYGVGAVLTLAAELGRPVTSGEPT